jgi:hypothetical protein
MKGKGLETFFSKKLRPLQHSAMAVYHLNTLAFRRGTSPQN